MAVKLSVRPGSASVCLVVESGGRRCCSAAGGVAPLLRPAPPFWPDGDGDGVAAGGCGDGALASSARAPATPTQGQKRDGQPHMTLRRETKNHVVCSLRHAIH